jgi:ribose transport system ATP-binding protein
VASGPNGRLPASDGELLVEMRGISKEFPGVQALDKVDFTLRRGETHVLLGENGAGKSTLIKILAGAYHPDGGTIAIRGRQVRLDNPKSAQRLGVSVIYQEFNLVPYLNVAQNIFLGREPRLRGIPGLMDVPRMHAVAAKMLCDLGVEIDTNAIIAELGVAQQQMVEVAKALLLDAEILVMDEPTAALTSREIDQLFAVIDRLKARGVGIIYISHRLQEVPIIADRVSVLRDGQYIGTVEKSGIDMDQLIRLMVGRTLTRMFPHEPVKDRGEEALRVDHVSRKGLLNDVSMVVRAGEIVGIAGLVGAGRSSLCRAIFGADPIDGGEIRVFGQSVTGKTPKEVVKLGVGFLPESRKTDGLALILPLRENVVMAGVRKHFPRGWIDVGREKELCQKYVDDLQMATPSVERLVKFLSGGTQQKVVLAKWLSTQSRLLIFDEPTRGIDVGAKSEIHQLMDTLVHQGCAVLMVSSELPEVLNMSDRIYVMRDGAIVKEFAREEAGQEEILKYAMAGGEEVATQAV